MANQESPLWERVGMDHDLSPPWTPLNMVKALKFGLLIIPPEQQTTERNKVFQMVTNRDTYQRQSWMPDAPAGDQAVFIPAARADSCLVPAIIEEHKLYFNLHINSLMSTWDPELCTTGDVH